MSRRVGVLFVHGIGEQRESESVRWFGRSILSWLESWYQARSNGRAARPEVISAVLSYGAELEGPARFTIRLPATSEADPDNVAVEWLIAEAHWAERISPPSFGAMVTWAWSSVRLVLGRLLGELGATLGTIGARIRHGSRRSRGTAGEADVRGAPIARSDPGLLAAIFELLSGAMLALLYLLALPLALLVLIPLFVVSLIPIESWRKFVVVELIEPFLVEGIGDFRTFVEDDVQAAHIRAGLAEDVEWLARTGACQDIVVVAHSQGAVVAFDALASPGFPAIGHVRKFLTVGGALNNAWQVYPSAPRLRRTLPRHILWVDFWSYYDPVAGSRLRPPQDAKIVDPTPELQEEMDWFEEYVHPERAKWGSKTTPTAPLPRQVTNGMNVLSDHDGYFRNPEQFLSRLASEIDRPTEDYDKSRFYQGDAIEKELSYRRRTRVSALVSWRLFAMASFLAATVAILARDGADRLTSAGGLIGSWIARIPGADVLGGPAAFFDGLRQILEVEAEQAKPSRWAEVLHAVAAFLSDPSWGMARDFAIAVVTIGLIFAATYFALVRGVFRPWDEREARASALPQTPPRNRVDVYVRGVFVLATLLVVTVTVVGP